jgi:serine/threonine-protein kinase PRP4
MQSDADEINAADYNPDGADDDRRQKRELEKERVRKEQEELKAESEDEEIEIEEEEEDDEDDMFAIGTGAAKKPKKVVKKKVKKSGVPVRSVSSFRASLVADCAAL